MSTAGTPATMWIGAGDAGVIVQTEAGFIRWYTRFFLLCWAVRNGPGVQADAPQAPGLHRCRFLLMAGESFYLRDEEPLLSARMQRLATQLPAAATVAPRHHTDVMAPVPAPGMPGGYLAPDHCCIPGNTVMNDAVVTDEGAA